jgi:hypothetical protein
MGLDIVEMVMALENAFQVRLPEEELARIRTVGELYDCVVRQLGTDGAPSQGELYQGDVWERYLDVIESETGADRRRLQPSASFVYDLGLYWRAMARGRPRLSPPSTGVGLIATGRDVLLVATGHLAR